MRKRGLRCRQVSVCLSVSLRVCLVVTFVNCIQTAEDIVRLFFRPGSPIIIIFLTPSTSTQLQGEPPSSLALNTPGVGKFCDFRLKWPFISETVRDRPMVAMER